MQQRIPSKERSKLRLWLNLPSSVDSQGSKGSRHKVITIVLVLAIIGVMGILAYVVTTPQGGEKFTEFYILGVGGKAENYPRELVLGEDARVILGIVNREHETTLYKVEITIDGEKVGEIGPITLEDKEKWEQEVSFTPIKAGLDQRVEFLLYKGVGTESYQNLRLWIDVEERS